MPIGNNGHGQKLPRKQEQTIAALLTCDSISAAATREGISEATVYRWLKDPTFEHAYRQARKEVVQHAIGQLQRATGTAVQVLVTIMEDTAASAGARVSAARTILERSEQSLLVEDLEARLTALEQQLRPH